MVWKIKPITDGFMRGLVSGFLAGALKDIPDLFLVELFQVKRIAFWDYVGVMILNRMPQGFGDHLLAIIIEITFSMGLGIIYSLKVIPAFSTRHFLIRGMVYGCACWFILESVIKLYHITSLFDNDIITPLLALLFSSGYGLLLALADRFFTPQTVESKK